MTVAWPTVRARLAAELPDLLPGVTVSDGPILSGNSPQAYLTIAHQPSAESLSAGGYDNAQEGTGGFLGQERGTVLLEAGAVTGVRGAVLEPSGVARGQASSRTEVAEFELGAQAVVVTSGGIGGNEDLVRAAWPARRSAPRCARGRR